MTFAVRPPPQVVRVQDIDLAAEPSPAFLERAHDAVVAVVEHTVERLGGDESLPGGAQVGRDGRSEYPADFARNDDIPRCAELTEDVAQALFTQAKAVV